MYAYRLFAAIFLTTLFSVCRADAEQISSVEKRFVLLNLDDFLNPSWQRLGIVDEIKLTLSFSGLVKQYEHDVHQQAARIKLNHDTFGKLTFQLAAEVTVRNTKEGRMAKPTKRYRALFKWKPNVNGTLKEEIPENLLVRVYYFNPSGDLLEPLPEVVNKVTPPLDSCNTSLGRIHLADSAKTMSAMNAQW